MRSASTSATGPPSAASSTSTTTRASTPTCAPRPACRRRRSPRSATSPPSTSRSSPAAATSSRCTSRAGSRARSRAPGRRPPRSRPGTTGAGSRSSTRRSRRGGSAPSRPPGAGPPPAPPPVGAPARADVDAAFAAANAAVEAMRFWFAVDTLEYLRRGGRIGAAQAWLGGALKIKPILTLDGEITPIERVRTSKRAFERMVEYMRSRADDGADAWVVQHVQSPDVAARLVEQGHAIYGCDPAFVSEVGPVIGAHVGPGLVGVGATPPPLLG